MRELYFDEASARTVLLGIGFPPSRLPSFGSAATFWPEVVLRLENGIIPDGIRRLLAAVVDDHPGNEAAQALALNWEVSIRISGESAPRADGVAAPVVVLCLFTDPVPGSKIRIDREARLLKEIEERGGITVATRHAVRASDIKRAMLDEKPRILHFAGHGTRDGRLMFDSDDGFGAAVSTGALAKVIAATTSEPLDCIVLNSCYTGDSAGSLRAATRSVAGSVTALDDGCAIAFAGGFYTGIARGQHPAKAFEAGRAEMGLLDCDTSGLHFDDFSR